MTQEELNTILDAHEKWSKSCGKEGNQAVFNNEDLSRLSFKGRDLRGIKVKNCILAYTDFSESDVCFSRFEDTILAHANFDKCDMQVCIFVRCDCTWTNFASVSLKNSKIENVTFACGCLTKTDFSSVWLIDTTFVHNNMIGTKFCGAVSDRTWFVHPIIHNTDFTDMQMRTGTTLCAFQNLTPRSGTIGLDEDTDVSPDDNDENMIFGGD